MKKAFIFDLFGTLVEVYEKEEYKKLVENMANALGIRYEEFHMFWNEDTYNDRMCGKFKSNYENIKFILDKNGIIRDEKLLCEAVKIRKEFAENSLKLYRKNLLETLENIKNRGYKIALISDCSPDVPDVWQELEYSKYFDVVIFSCLVELKKPDEKIYKLATDRLGVKAEECYYIGDGGSFELTGAGKVGMHPVLIKSINDEKKDVYKKYLDDFNGDRIYDLAELKKYV